jgi:NAD(P)-dependent dehydrogenase (short-subunit alcohol dehydrogenase family)
MPAGKHAPDGVKILPLDLASGEDSLKAAVEKAESFFPGAGVDYMIHNAAFERPVCEILLLFSNAAFFHVKRFRVFSLKYHLTIFLCCQN